MPNSKAQAQKGLDSDEPGSVTGRGRRSAALRAPRTERGPGLRIAAIVPCLNEALTVQKVVHDVQTAIPQVVVYVYDNGSKDGTAELAAQAGAIVRREERKGKGTVMARAFADVDADVYITIDGDDTYEADDLPTMIDLLRAGPYDHVLGVRREQNAHPARQSAYRSGHEVGNHAFNALTGWMFGTRVTDMLSGCRVFSRRFVKSFPALSRQFEVETELTVHMMALRLPHAELPVGFRDRPSGSHSKLSTVRDGLRILNLLVQLLRHERPTLFYGLITAVMFTVSLALGIPIVVEYFHTGLVPRLPTAVAASACMILAMLLAGVGLVLDGLLRARRESARLKYLEFRPVDCDRDSQRSHPPVGPQITLPTEHHVEPAPRSRGSRT